MNATLNVTSSAVAYFDSSSTNNPTMKAFDWARKNLGVPVDNPKSDVYSLPAGAAISVFDGSRTTGINSTTEFLVSLSHGESSRYRIQHTGGDTPVFRTHREVQLEGDLVSFSVSKNLTAKVALKEDSFGTFVAVQAGDTVFVPHTSTGDEASPFSSINAGFWIVLAKPNSRALTLVRPVGVKFEAVSESDVEVAYNSQFQVFSSDGVQVGDNVDILAGFSTANQRVFRVAAVTPDWIEVVSSAPMAEEGGAVPGPNGMKFYTGLKRYLHIEADQECVVKINGDSGESVRISPIEAGSRDQMGWLSKFGPVYSLSVTNRSTSAMSVVVISAE